MNIKLLYLCFLVLLLNLLCISKVFAEQNFKTDYYVIYTVENNGLTHTLINASLTNTTTQFYASSYKIKLGLDSISNLQVSDPQGYIIPQVTKTKNGFDIDITFNKKSVGRGSTLPFKVSFDTQSVARKQGRILEINIPGIENPSDFNNFTAEVQAPSSLGKPTYIKPIQANDSLIFTKDQLGESGISIAFGKMQIFSFNLKYHLKNDNLLPVQTEIALPPSTNYQNVQISNINPRPKNVILDKDGNWLAQYNLLPSQKIDINVLGKAEIDLLPQKEILESEILNKYLSDKQYWDSNNQEIRDLAKKLKTPKNIYDYSAKTLHYNFSRVINNQSRLGALEALKDPSSAVCREFTDLFIAISRAAGIPAREIDGFAYTQNAKERPLSLIKDILHAWPEYYDSEKRTWIMVDPTWASTTNGTDYFSVLDFDHFAFAIRGTESNYPIPAGGYKFANSIVSRDVNVSFADDYSKVQPDFDLQFSPSNEVVAGLPIIEKVIIKNNGGNILSKQVLSITSSTFLPSNQVLNIPDIPPFGTGTVNIMFKPTFILTNSDNLFTIQLADKKKTGSIKILPFFLTKFGIGGILLGLLIIILFIITIKLRRLRIFG